MHTEDFAMIVRTGLCFLFSLGFSADVLAQKDPLFGIDSNYGLDMATRHKAWKVRSEMVDPCELEFLGYDNRIHRARLSWHDQQSSPSVGKGRSWQRKKLTSYRLKDRVHILDMIGVGLLDETWPARFPAPLGDRLQRLLDDPNG
jgi:hypothetical protein